jgi:5-(carboxyamino)imidazole ribonucleotide mutase/phosphoribosylaminoimidazole-succinocarboxamide synthase
MKPLLVILMGSKADLAQAQKVAETAVRLGLDVEQRIGSAHKTAGHVLNLLREYEVDPRAKVYLTIAGRSNALSGFTDGLVSAPVIACPPYSEAFGGADIFSSLRMPSGIAPAVVLEPANAALLAAKILGLTDPGVHQAVIEYQRGLAETVVSDDSALQGER